MLNTTHLISNTPFPRREKAFSWYLAGFCDDGSVGKVKPGHVGEGNLLITYIPIAMAVALWPLCFDYLTVTQYFLASVQN